MWSRFLINNRAPDHAFVSDSGGYVITTDHGRSPDELPLVIYGQNGALVRVHNIDSLGLRNEIFGSEWDTDALSFFSTDERTFFIRLHGGKWIMLDLVLGDVLVKQTRFFRDDLRQEHEQKWKRLEEYRQTELKKQTIRLLSSADPFSRKTGAMVCGQEKYTDTVPMLRTLLKDRSWFTTMGAGRPSMIVLYVRQAAKQALEAMGEKVANVITELPEAGHLRVDRKTQKYELDFDEGSGH